MTLWIILGALWWYIAGIWGFVFWWTHDFDLTTKQLPLMFFVGILGPFAWLIGAEIHRGRLSTVLKKRRL